MTRARCYALAVLVGVCCLSRTPAFAQPVPLVPGSGSSAPYFPPDRGYTPQPLPQPPAFSQPPAYGADDPLYCTVDEAQAAGNRVGPLVRTDGGFLRMEYLLWTIGRPRGELLGAPVLGVARPQDGFVAFAPGTTTPVAFATVPNTDSIDLSSISGFRVTGGVNFIDGGRVEVSGFMLARKQSGFTLDNFGSTFSTQEGSTLPNAVATSLLENGQISSHLLLYNVSYQAIFQSQLWGAEANYFFDGDDDRVLQTRPLIGARYLNFSERLTQQGTFVDPLTGGPAIISTIDSQTTNNLWGAQIGFRTQIVSKYLELGITPKLLLLGDTMVSNVFSNHLRSNNDPLVATRGETTAFSFGADVGTYAQLNLSPSFSARVGYSLLWLDRVTRPHKDIVYNDNGQSAPPGIISQLVMTEVFISGLNLGFEFRF